MSFGHKEIDGMEVDDMNLKSHLDTSFEESGLRVSEDLIRKTMEAINQQTLNKSVEDKKVVNYKAKVNQRNMYIRRYAGVAAAVVLLIVGYQMVQNVGLGTNSKSSDNERSYDIQESASEEQQDSSSTDSLSEVQLETTTAAEDAKTNYTVADEADSMETDEQAPMMVTEEPEVSVSDSTYGSTMIGNANNSEGMTFSQICLLIPEDVTYLKITNVAKENSMILTDQTKIKSFYEAMDNHLFTNGTKSSVNWYYIIEVKKQEEATTDYDTIWVGDSLMVQYSNDSEENYSSYDAVDQVELIKELDAFYEENVDK